jgi:glucose-1-phosphate thymidylyltransferase
MTSARMNWKGLILAGGYGTRLFPMTIGSNKHLLNVYDKPMIYYALTTLMLGGIREIVLLSTPAGVPLFQRLLGDGSEWGLHIDYVVQEHPNGIGEGLLLAERYTSGKHVALILGDNIFYGSGLSELLYRAIDRNDGASIFTYEVSNPQAFGIVTLNEAGVPVSIAEKPERPESSLAVTGLYLYGPDVLDVAKCTAPSKRGELEITDINRAYLEQSRLKVYPLSRGYAWLDGGTPNDLFEASQFIRVVETRTGLKIGCRGDRLSHGIHLSRTITALGRRGPERRIRRLPCRARDAPRRGLCESAAGLRPLTNFRTHPR